MENIQLTALLPDQMKPAQENLISWCSAKITSLQADVKELKDSIFHASTMKWATNPLKRQQAKVEKRIQFFEKIKACLEAGYVIVPNFPVQLFAIRTTKESPLQMFSSSYWDNKRQTAMELPIGRGEYQNPVPIVERERIESDGKVNTSSYATDWAELEFPITMIKPEIIGATNKAMALEVFDQFGVLPATKNEDPIIVGQIINKCSAYRRKTVSFMIAWHFDTRVL